MHNSSFVLCLTNFFNSLKILQSMALFKNKQIFTWKNEALFQNSFFHNQKRKNHYVDPLFNIVISLMCRTSLLPITHLVVLYKIIIAEK